MTRHFGDLTPAEQGLVRSIGEQLLGVASQFTRGMFTNAYVWVSRQGEKYQQIEAALIGEPTKVAVAFGHFPSLDDDHEYGMRGQWLDHMAKRVFGPDADIFAYERSVHISEFLQRLANLLDGDVSLTFIPEPGYPWPTSWYWDAKKKRAVVSKRPEWLIEVEDRDTPGKMVHGVNPCLFFPPEPHRSSRAEPVMGDLRGTPLMAAHSMQLTALPRGGRTFEESARSVRACGGLLLPSLSVGPVPASNFGYGCLVARLGLVLDGLKPYRARNGDRAVWVYPSDVWTGTTGTFLNAWAKDLFDELHGHEDHTYGHGFTVLGVPKVASGGPSGGAEALDSTAQLARELKRRMRRWLEVETKEEFEALDEELSGTDAKYAYCEIKARRVIELSEFPYFIVPSDLVDVAEAWAREVGYRGEVVPVKWRSRNPQVDLDVSWDQWQWALKVADVVRELRPVVRIET